MNTVIWLNLVALVATGAFGQHAGNFGQGRINSGPIQARPAPPVQAPFARGFGSGRRSFLSPVFPFVLGGYDYDYAPGYDYGYAAAPNMTIVQQPPVYVIVPPSPIVPAILEYTSPLASSTALEQPAFAIVLKDGSIHSALAVSVQDDMLYYVDSERGHLRVSLDAVDREATARRNRERKLELRLPPPTTK
jgi:hypothetical protein